jgi:hypothetical protein
MYKVMSLSIHFAIKAVGKTLRHFTSLLDKKEKQLGVFRVYPLTALQSDVTAEDLPR